MRLLIAGTAVQDTIIENGKVSRSPGGISYTLTALKSFAGTDDELWVATVLPEEIPSEMKPVFEDIKYYNVLPAPSFPSVTLTIHKERERDEVFDFCDIPISVPVNGLGNFDGLLVNMITGFDLTLESLREVRRNFNGIIYIDIHTLARGLDKSNGRIFQPVPEAEEWLKNTDIVQCNENELQMLSPLKSHNLIAGFVLSCGVKYLLVTLGADGAKMYFREKGDLRSVYISPVKTRTVTAVGCGDVFGAAFFYYFVKEKNAVTSLYAAVKYSGLATGYNSVYDLINLKKDAISRPD